MKLIPLSQGKFAKVDDEDFSHLVRWKWSFSTNYAVRNYRKMDGKQTSISMQKELLGAPPAGHEIDHINRDRLDNQKHNLRFASVSQNQFNQKKKKTNTSGFKGVTFNKSRNSWVAVITAFKRKYYIGSYHTAEEAGAAYDRVCLKLHGEFARPNGPIFQQVEMAL